MRESAKKFEFEKAAKLRDRIKELREKEFLFGYDSAQNDSISNDLSS
jgi:protein-arginine kinase activator protein McsA